MGLHESILAELLYCKIPAQFRYSEETTSSRQTDTYKTWKWATRVSSKQPEVKSSFDVCIVPVASLWFAAGPVIQAIVRTDFKDQCPYTDHNIYLPNCNA